MPVNALIPKPTSPGSWVDEEACICGESYSVFSCGVTFTEARNAIKELNRDNYDGFKTRRTVLWMMRVMKLESWYLRHTLCGGDYD